MHIIDYTYQVSIATPAHWDRCGRDRMVVGFITACAISVYHHKSCELEPLLIQPYVIKFVSVVTCSTPSIKLLHRLLFPYKIIYSPTKVKHHLTCFNNIFSKNELISNRFAVFVTCTRILTYL